MTVLKTVVEALNRHGASSQVANWTTTFHRDRKWHKKDRLVIGPSGSPEACLAYLAIRKDGTGVVFSHNYERDWYTAVMTGWDRKAAASALLACVAWHAVPPEYHRAMVYRWRKDGGSFQPQELKPFQDRIRRSKGGWNDERRWPRCVKDGLDKLEVRHAQLRGLDVKEKIQSLDRPFRFLQSKGVPFDRIRQAWDEALVSEVMES
jgi:hypothetical protein